MQWLRTWNGTLELKACHRLKLVLLNSPHPSREHRLKRDAC
jgi:hypothetical protein